MEKLLDVNNLRVSFNTYAGEVKAVRGVSFELNEGETLAFVGESGCGKTVTAKAIMRLLQKPFAEIKEGSQVVYRGQDVLKMSKKELQSYRGDEVSMIFQDPMTSLNPTMTVGKQIMESLILHRGLDKKAAREEAINMLKLVKIPDAEKRVDAYPHEMSGGMRQRVMIAIALSCNPALLIADEPTTALDVTIQAQIMELLGELKKELNTAIILVTHDLGVVASMCERIAVMYAGKIVEYGTTEDIFYHPKHEYTKGLIRSIPRIDTKEHERLVPIEGSPVDLLNPPKGCPFAPRCEKCMKICLREMPPVTNFDEVHYTQCWLNQKEEMEKGAANE